MATNDYRDIKGLIADKYHGFIRQKQANNENVSAYMLRMMVNLGILEKIGRGLYVLKDYPFSYHESLIEACKKVPNGVVCLTSALAYYELTDTIPHQVHMAIERKSRAPRVDYPPIKFFWFSKKAYDSGIIVSEERGGEVKIYAPEKSIADSFKYRNKIGEKIAIEVLKEYISRGNYNIDKLINYSKICRVEGIVIQTLKGIL